MNSRTRFKAVSRVVKSLLLYCSCLSSLYAFFTFLTAYSVLRTNVAGCCISCRKVAKKRLLRQVMINLLYWTDPFNLTCPIISVTDYSFRSYTTKRGRFYTIYYIPRTLLSWFLSLGLLVGGDSFSCHFDFSFIWTFLFSYGIVCRWWIRLVIWGIISWKVEFLQGKQILHFRLPICIKLWLCGKCFRRINRKLDLHKKRVRANSNLVIHRDSGNKYIRMI